MQLVNVSEEIDFVTNIHLVGQWIYRVMFVERHKHTTGETADIKGDMTGCSAALYRSALHCLFANLQAAVRNVSCLSFLEPLFDEPDQLTQLSCHSPALVNRR